MNHAAKRKSSLPAGLTALRFFLVLIAGCSGLNRSSAIPSVEAETRVWGFAPQPEQAFRPTAFATFSSVGEVYDAFAYDGPGSLVAAKAVGNGPAKGFLEVNDAFKSSKAVQNFGSAKPLTSSSTQRVSGLSWDVVRTVTTVLEQGLQASGLSAEFLKVLPFEDVVATGLESHSEHWTSLALNWAEQLPASPKLQSALQTLRTIDL